MSAFGGSGLSASARISNAAAPAMEELDAAEDFLDNETTKIHDHFESDYPVDADATVVARDASSAFLAEKRQTPVVPAVTAPPPTSVVPDLFGPDSFGPAPGEFIDASLLDPAVPTVPPPGAPGIPAEAFQVSQRTEPVWTTAPTAEKKVSSVWIVLLALVLVLAAGAVAAWQLGFADDLMDLAAPYLGRSLDQEDAVKEPPQVAQPVAGSAVQPEEVTAAAQPAEDVVVADEAEAKEDAEPGAEAAPAKATQAGSMSFQVTSRPPGAFVSVNGKGVGRTPLELDYEVGTKLSLFSKARGYLARRQKITVQTDQEAVNLVLAPLPYVIQVVTNPPGARASAVGGGEVVTPGALRFRSMPDSRAIVVSKDGYKTANASVARADFIEEPRRMAASVNLTLQKDGAAGPTEPAASTEETATPDPASAEPPPSEVKAEAEPSAEPEPVDETPAPSETDETSETDAADAP